MGNIHSSSSKRKRKVIETEINYMERNFGLPSGQITQREPLTPDLFMKVGTRLGVITAYYKHLCPLSAPVNQSNNNNPSCPVVNVPSIQNTPKIDQSTSVSEIHIYDVPKNIQTPNE